MIIAAPVYFILGIRGINDDLAISVAFMIAGLVTFATILPSVMKEKERAKARPRPDMTDKEF